MFRVGMQSMNPSIKLQSPQGYESSLAATALLVKLDKKRRDRWSEAVRSIDFSLSSRKAWSILNNLTGRLRQSPRHCPVSADAIASELVRNRKYEAADCKSSRLSQAKKWYFLLLTNMIDMTVVNAHVLYCMANKKSHY